MGLKHKPHRRITAEQLATWLERQRDAWWSVDGDPRLMEQVDFPCPGDELAPAIRNIGVDVLVGDPGGKQLSRPGQVDADELDRYADTDNVDHERVFLCSWADSDIEWLLCEDIRSAAAYPRE
ncbi:MAG: hypothetical protein HY718_11630 [Planctomycetes bacterium]|nr:hypothetical protein [Planctomycetota bacterium]